MQIQLNTDHTIPGSESLAAHLDRTVRTALERFASRVTRVEVHLTDMNGRNKSGGDDKRCTMEARIAGRQPLSVSHDAPAVALAIDGATTKMGRALDSVFGKLEAARRHGASAATDEAT